MEGSRSGCRDQDLEDRQVQSRWQRRLPVARSQTMLHLLSRVLCGSMQVKDWPREEYGKFYNGDSYIILNTYKEADSEVR